jgi:hypothetical protein
VAESCSGDRNLVFGYASDSLRAGKLGLELGLSRLWDHHQILVVLVL